MFAQQQQQQQQFQSIPLDSVESQWEMLFYRFDRNHDGKISINELNHALRQGAGEQYNIHPKILAIIANKADHNQDGYINLREFLNLMEEEPIAKSLITNLFNKYIHYTIVPRGPPRLRTAGVDRTDGDYEDEFSCNPPALCMVIVSLVEVLFFTWDALITKNNDSQEGPMASMFIYNPTRKREAWRFLTYMFVHIGLEHLIFNLIIQLLLGVPLEMVHRGWRVVLIYLSGVLAGSLVTSVANPNVLLSGASGGVYALLTAHVATIIINWSEMECAIYQLLIFGFLITYDLSTSIYQHFIIRVQNRTSYAAHLGGAIAGLLVGVYTLRNLHVRPWEKKLCWSCFFIYVLLTGSCGLWDVIFPEYFSKKTIKS